MIIIISYLHIIQKNPSVCIVPVNTIYIIMNVVILEIKSSLWKGGWKKEEDYISRLSVDRY